jgi:hypothetical protein
VGKVGGCPGTCLSIRITRFKRSRTLGISYSSQGTGPSKWFVVLFNMWAPLILI